MVIRAAQMAVWQRHGSDPVITPLGQGSQFRSGDYQAYLKANGLVCSMGPVGHFGDNAACEGFFWLFKRERVYRTKYPTLDAARDDVFEYIERFHNPGMRRRTARQDLKFSTPSRPSVASWESPDESSMNLRRRTMLTVKDRGYNSPMPKDVVLDSSGDLRERSLAVLISVALHLAAFGWMWLGGDQAGWGESEESEYSGSDGMSVDFLARDDFRQRIETRPALASHEVATASEGPTKSLPSTPIEPAVDLPNSAEPVDSNPSHASGGK